MADYTFTLNVWGAKQRPWGYEVRVDVTWVETGRVFNEVLLFPDKATALDAQASGAAKDELRARIKAQLQAEAAYQPTYCPTCGTQLS